MDNNNPKPTSSNPRSKSITVVKRKTNKVGNYLLGQTIGEGGFAKVKLATHIYTQQHVAIKILNKDKIIKDQSDLIRIKKEINILKQLKHKNIIQLYEIMESKSLLYIVMEYCEGKELFDLIIKRKRITEREACRFFQQIINGVEYLHMQNITHRDLKPENLLLDNKKRIIISDFGLSTYANYDNELLKTSCGTPSYAPPEMLRGEEYNGRYSDIWSCGVILYTMLCGNLPCAESKEDLIYDYIMAQEMDYPEYLSNLAMDLLKRLLRIEPEKRLNFDQIKTHPWFNLMEAQMRPGLIIGVHRIPVDESIIARVGKYGYDKEKCRESIVNNRFDSYSCIYYLILKEVCKEGRQSVSDLCSDEYVIFLRNVNNWVKPQEARKRKYDDYWPEEEIANEIELVLPKNRVKALNKSEHAQAIEDKDNTDSKDSSTPVLKPNEVSMKSIKTFDKPNHYENKIENNDKDDSNVEEDIDSNLLKLKLLALKQANDRFFKSINDIDSLTKSTINTITPIANKLIKETIFSKYISPPSSLPHESSAEQSDLKHQFTLMQKYKGLIENIEMTHPGIFPKKVYDSTLVSFDTFLTEEEDFVFSTAFLNNKNNNDFLDKIKRGIQSYHRKVNSQHQYYSERKSEHYQSTLCISKEVNLNTMTKRDRDREGRGNRNRRRQIVSISSYITDKQSEERLVSSSIKHSSAWSLDKPSLIKQPINNLNHNPNPNPIHFIHCNKILINKDISATVSVPASASASSKQTPTKVSRNLNLIIKPQLTTSTNNSKKQKTRKDFYIDEFILKTDYKKRIQFETPKYWPTDLNRLQVKCLNSRNKEIHLGTFTKNVNNFNQLHLLNAFIHQFNRKAPSTTTNQRKKSLSFHQKSDNSSGKNMSTSQSEHTNTNTNKTEAITAEQLKRQQQQELNQLSVYSGIADLSCCIQISPNGVIKVIRDFFKSNCFFCIYTHNKFICSKDNSMIEITVMKLLQTSMVYLKIKRIKGDRAMFYHITKELISIIGLLK